MATNIVFNGTTYSIPAEGDTYGDTLSSYLIAIASATLQKSGGSFALTNELNFGASYGLKLSYIKSQATNPASSGVLRLGNTDAIKFRNAANTSDLSLSLSTDSIQFNSINLVDVSSTQTLTNKTLTSPAITTPTGIVKADVGLSNVDNTSDATKNAATATLTNKTISGASNTLTDVGYSSLVLSNSVVNADISASAAIAYSKLNLASSIVNADINASAAIEMSKLEPLTAEKLVVTNPSGQITTIATTAIQAGYLNGVTSAIQTQLDAKATSASLSSHASATSTHGVSGNIVGTTDSQSLTNKDIDGGTASNSSRITIPKNTLTNLQALTRKQGTIVFDTTANKPYYDDGSNLKVIGSGAGGAINFIADGDAEAAQILTGYTSSSVGTRPAGTQSAGASNLTLSQTTSSPLSGSQSFVITKAAANAQGQNASIPFSVDLAYRAKAVTISFDYLVNSGTFQAGSNFGTIQDSDVIVYIYDVTNSTYIEPSSIRLLSNSTSIADKFQATFQTSVTGSSYRLILHVATTSASAWAVKCENFIVGPSNYVFGTPVTDWQSYTPTVTAVTSNPTPGTGVTSAARWRRVGDSIEIVYYYGQTGAGSGGTGTYLWSLPNGYSIDTNKVTTSTAQIGTLAHILGNGQVSSTTAQSTNSANEVTVVAYNSTSLSLISSNGTTAGQRYPIGSSSYSYGNTVTYHSFRAIVPCVGLSSSVQMSDSADTRVTTFHGYKGANQSITANTTDVTFTAATDTHGSWNGSSYLVPSSGNYLVQYRGLASGSASNIMVYLDGSLYGYLSDASTTILLSGSILVPARAGQFISIRGQTSTTIVGNVASLSSFTGLTITKISGPAQIAASEVVKARYTISSGASTASGVQFNFDTKVYDSHNAVTTGAGVWKFTAPTSGNYQVTLQFYSATTNTSMGVYKNGSLYGVICAVNTSFVGNGSLDIDLISGDYVDVRAASTLTPSAASGYSVNTSNHIQIKRVGLL